MSKAIQADNEGKRYVNAGFLLFDHYSSLDAAAAASEVMRSAFLERFKAQHLEELLSFQRHVIKTLDSICAADTRNASPMVASPMSMPGSGAPNGRVAMFFGAAVVGSQHRPISGTNSLTTAQQHVVSITKLREVYKVADPHITRSMLNALLARGAQCEVDELLIMEAKREALPYENFKCNLLKKLLKKSMPQPEKKKKK